MRIALALVLTDIPWGYDAAYGVTTLAAEEKRAACGIAPITTDAHCPYLHAVEDAFGADADYAMLHKIYGAPHSG
jgi:hypothetical protein